MSLKTLRKQYDTKILACREELRQLKEARNKDCSATRDLSLEILAAIFRYAIRPYTKRRSPRAMIISHVCRCWRKVALDEPRLWGNLDGLSVRWTHKCLKRSKGSPLRIWHVDEYERPSRSDTDSPYARGKNLDSVPEDSEYADYSPEEICGMYRDFDPSEKTKDILFKHSARLEQLHIDSCQTDTIARLNQPTPHLSLLTVFGTCEFPPDFLGGVAPAGLHTVKMYRCSLSLGDWSQNIHHLRLSRCRLDGDVFAALSAMTHLEDLRISFHKDPVAPFAEDKSYLLPNLHTATFSLRAGHQLIVNTFPRISAPNLKQLVMTWPPRFEDEVLASRATHIFKALSPEAINWVSSKFDKSKHRLEFKGDGSSIIFHNFQPKSLSSFLKLSSIEDSCVRTLHLEHLPALRELISSGDSAGSEALACPALRVLRLQSMTLNDGEVTKVSKKQRKKGQVLPPDNTPVGPSTFTRLEGWLASRRNVSQLEKLDIIDCRGLPSEWLVSLRKILPVD